MTIEKLTSTHSNLAADHLYHDDPYPLAATQSGYFAKKKYKKQFIVNNSESPLLKVSSDVHYLIALHLNDRDRQSFMATSFVFWRNKYIRSDWLCRKVFPSLQVIPTYLIQHVLLHQSPKKLKRLLNLLPTIKSGLSDIMHHEAHAEWILYALLDVPIKVEEILGGRIAFTTTRIGYYVLYFYAIANHWDTFVAHIKKYYPNFKYENTAFYNDLSCLVILGGNIEFYQRLIKLYGFPDYTVEEGEAIFLMLDAIASGKSETVEALAATCPEIPEPADKLFSCFRIRRPAPPILEFVYLAQAARLGRWNIFDFLTAGDNPFCAISNAAEAAEILLLAAEFDDLPRVRYFLEDQKARLKWHLTSKTTCKGMTLRRSVLMGGSEKTLTYFLNKNKHFLEPKNSVDDPPLLISA
ncbi:MAG: hypothetical protein M3R00_09270, partial [Pseudomonadota bacterium]|nr:hypothetical protein [Pseudomonadota bacterium]